MRTTLLITSLILLHFFFFVKGHRQLIGGKGSDAAPGREQGRQSGLPGVHDPDRLPGQLAERKQNSVSDCHQLRPQQLRLRVLQYRYKPFKATHSVSTMCLMHFFLFTQLPNLVLTCLQ